MIKADVAREISAAALQAPALERYILEMDALIGECAGSGARAFSVEPFTSRAAWNAMGDMYRANGFSWVDDVGGDRTETHISW